MGSASSRVDQNIERTLDKVKPTGLLTNYTLSSESTLLSLGKHASCLDKYNVIDIQSGKPVFSVQSDLSAKGDRGKRTQLFDATSETMKSILSVSSFGASSWQISTETIKETMCRIKETSTRRTSMEITFKDMVGNEGRQVVWLLKGDKVRFRTGRGACDPLTDSDDEKEETKCNHQDVFIRQFQFFLHSSSGKKISKYWKKV